MDSRFDIFELPPNGVPRWVSSTASLEEARRQMEALPIPEQGGEYLIRDFCSCSVVAYRAPHLPRGTVVIKASQPNRRAAAGNLRR
jgi:hypothetical protein